MKDKIKYRIGDKPIIISLTRSAPIQIIPFPKIQELCDHWKTKGYTNIIDIGCGRLRNSLFLINHFKLWICDFPTLLESTATQKRYNKLKKHPNFLGLVHPSDLSKKNLQAHAAILAFVLNTLPEKHLRERLIKNATKNTIPPHEIFITVPNGEHYYKQRMQKKNQLNDGFIFDAGAGNHTFYREYSAREIDGFMHQLGFNVDKVFPAYKKNQRTYVRTARPNS